MQHNALHSDSLRTNKCRHVHGQTGIFKDTRADRRLRRIDAGGANLAIGVAARYGAQIIAIHVVNIDQYLQALGVYRISYPDPIKKRIEEAKQEASKWFTEIQKNAEQEKVQVKTDVIDTPLSVVGGIVNYAEREKVDLIVIGTRGKSGFTKLLLGSVASGVVTYAPCPVMVAR